MPAIGASTTGAATSYGPIDNGTVAIVAGPAARSEQPAGILGQADGLGAGPGAGLADRGRQMVADRPLRQVQRGGEVGDGATVARGTQHVGLAGGQRARPGGERLGGEPGVDDAQPG